MEAKFFFAVQYSHLCCIYKMSQTMKIEEQILAEGCRKGEDTARRELYDRFAGRLLGICLRYTGERAAAEDLMHDAFIKIYGAFDRFSYRGPGSLRAWIERITINIALEWIRARNKRNMVLIDEERIVSDVAEPDQGEITRIPQETLMSMVGELPDGYRTVFNLFCIEGYSHRDIAEMLGINEKSSSSQLFRAKTLLARKIKAYLEVH